MYVSQLFYSQVHILVQTSKIVRIDFDEFCSYRHRMISGGWVKVQNHRRVSFREASKAQHPRRVSFREAWKAQNPRRVSFRDVCKAQNPRLTGTIRLRGVKPFLGGSRLERLERPKTLGGSRLERLGRPKALGLGSLREAWKTQILRGVSFREAWKTQTPRGVSFGQANGQFWYHFGPKAA